MSVRNFLVYIEKKIGSDLFSFLSHSKNYISADFFQKGLVFLTIPIFTRILSPDEYGILSIFTSLVTIFSVFEIIGGQGAVVRFYNEPGYNFKHFLGSILIFYLIYSILITSILLCFSQYIANYLKINNKVVQFAILISAVSIYSMLYLSFLQASKKSSKFSWFSVTINTTILLSSIVWMIFLNNEKYFGRIYSQFIIDVVLLAFFLFSLFRLAKVNINFTYIKDLTKFGVPLIPHALSGIILVYFDRIIINQVVGAEEAGLYSFAYNIGMVMQLIVLAMNRAWQPLFYENYTKNDITRIERLSEKYSTLIYFIAITLILFVQEMVQLLATKQYSNALPIVPVIILSYVFLFLYTLIANYSFFYKKTALISLATTLVMVLNVALNYLLVPKFGYKIAAYTTLFSYMLLFVAHYCIIRYVLKVTNLIHLKSILQKLLFVFVTFILVLLQYKLLDNLVIIYVLKISYLIIITYFMFYLPQKNIKHKIV